MRLGGFIYDLFGICLQDRVDALGRYPVERSDRRLRMRFAASVVVAGLVAGCNAGGIRVSSLDAGTQTATYHGVMLGNVSEIYRQAHAYCSAYDKSAQMVEDGVPDGTVTFACLD
jgi:hypothetical protein